MHVTTGSMPYNLKIVELDFSLLVQLFCINMFAIKEGKRLETDLV